MLILAKGVEISGALRPVGRLLARAWLSNRHKALLATLVVPAFVSAFANNTPIVVMILPLLVGAAHRIGAPPSRMLMPVGFATIIGGIATTTGTSTNLLVVSVSRRLGGPEFAMLPAGLAAVAGIAYLWSVAPRLIPERVSPLAGSGPQQFHAVTRVDAGSRFVGRTLAEVAAETGGRVRFDAVQHGAELVRSPSTFGAGASRQPSDRCVASAPSDGGAAVSVSAPPGEPAPVLRITPHATRGPVEPAGCDSRSSRFS